MMIQLLRQGNRAIDSWFTTPEINAAQRLGWFRLIYCGFYLWHLSYHFTALLSNLPNFYFRYIWLVEPLPEPPSALIFELLESVVVCALVLLAIGWRVRWSTAAVLLFGSVLEAYYYSTDSEHASIFLTFYIPFFMLLYCRWGDTYSLDALLAKRRRQTKKPHSSHWSYFLPARCLLITLVLFFVSAFVAKIYGQTWFQQPDLMANHVLNTNIKAAIYDLPSNPLAPLIAQNTWLHRGLQWFTLLFEATFPLVLLKRQLASLYFALALVFHAANGIWFTVSFTPVLIIYLLYVDWESASNILLGKQKLLLAKFLDRLPESILWVSALAVATVVSLLWNQNLGMRALFNLGGLLTWQTIWYPVLPLALCWLMRSAIELKQLVGRG